MTTGQMENHSPVEDTGKYHFPPKTICSFKIVSRKVIKTQTSPW